MPVDYSQSGADKLKLSQVLFRFTWSADGASPTDSAAVSFNRFGSGRPSAMHSASPRSGNGNLLISDQTAKLEYSKRFNITPARLGLAGVPVDWI